MIYEGQYVVRVEAESGNEARALLEDCGALLADAVVDGEPEGVVTTWMDTVARKVES